MRGLLPVLLLTLAVLLGSTGVGWMLITRRGWMLLEEGTSQLLFVCGNPLPNREALMPSYIRVCYT